MSRWSVVASLLVLTWVALFGLGVVGRARRRMRADRTPLGTLRRVQQRVRRTAG